MKKQHKSGLITVMDEQSNKTALINEPHKK